MNRMRTLCLAVFSLAFFLLGFNVWEQDFLEKSLKEQDSLAAHRLGKSLGLVIEQAHRANDDLTLQAVVQGASRAPGVLVACVVDPQEKVLAHTLPSEIGQPFHSGHRQTARSTLWSFPLDGEGTPWGTLVFALSRHLTRQVIHQQIALLILLDVGVIVFMIFCSSLVYKSFHDFKRQLKEKTEIVEEQAQEILRTTQSQVQSQMLWTSWVQHAVGLVERPVLLLDNHQRVLASNAKTLKSLGVESSTAIEGKSWQEVPAFDACGEALQRSLESPGQPVDASLSGPDGTLHAVFLSKSASEESGIGTWVFI